MGAAIDAALDLALDDAVLTLNVLAGTNVEVDSAALTAAKISDARDAADVLVSDSEIQLTTDTEALNEAHGLAIGRYDSFLNTQAATTAAGKAELEANAANDEAVLVAGAIIAPDTAAATIKVAEFEGNITNVTVDADGAEVADAGAVTLFAVDDEGVASLNTDNVTVDAADASSYVIGTGDGVTVTASFIDDVLATFQSELDAQAAVADAVEAEVAALALLGAAVGAAADATEEQVLDVAELDAYITAVGFLDVANTAHDALEAAIAYYETVSGIDAGITALELAAEDAQAAVDGADVTDLNAAVAAVENALDDAEAPGLNFVYDDGVDASNDYVYAADLAGENIIGGDFLDIIDFGAGYVFTTVAADANVVEDAVGDANVLEVLLQQNSDVDGLPTTVSVWIETSAADGSASTTAEADFTITNADGDLSLADLDLSVDGLIITGLYDTGLGIA